MSQGIHPALMGLIQELPPVGSVWLRADQECWLKAFEAVMDYIYPLPTEKEPDRLFGIRIVELDTPRQLELSA